MSLWEKWERESLKRQGVDTEYKSEVDIQDTNPKPSVRQQALTVGGVILGCLLVVYFALIMNAIFGGYWSDTFIVRFFTEKESQRIELSDTR